MAERIESVESGGLRKFSYDKDYNPKLDEARKKDIKKGYEEAEQFRNSIPDPLKFFDHQYETIPPYLAWQKSMAKEKIQSL